MTSSTDSVLLGLEAQHAFDMAIAILAVTFVLTQRLWFPYMPIADNISEDFWAWIPQQDCAYGVSAGKLIVPAHLRSVRTLLENSVSHAPLLSCYYSSC